MIKDEYTELKISRQRKFQLRQKKKGLCEVCRKKAATGSTLCAAHNKSRALFNLQKRGGVQKVKGRWLGNPTGKRKRASR